MTKTRTETDTFGPIEVDDSRYWGAQAQRSLGNFKIGWEKQPAAIVRALGIIKRAAAETSMALGHLDKAIGEFDIRAPDRQVTVGHLSGGNQQKLLLAKTMLVEPEIIIIDEPTRGIDIGTKQQIYGFIERLAAAGKSIIIVSSEMAEVIGLSHRVVVMRAGRIVGELQGEAITEEAIVLRQMGLKGAAVA